MRIQSITVVAVFLLLAGCGQKGPLYRDTTPAPVADTVQPVNTGTADSRRDPPGQ